jgi:threonine synthase
VIPSGARVVAVLTGHLLKDPASVPPGPALEIEPDLTAVERALRS